jgi:hypothetical protein
MKSSNRWNVLNLDKTEEEIIKSFGVKQNDGLTWKGEKDTIMTIHGLYPLLQTLTIWFDGYGTTNSNIKAWVGGITNTFNMIT